MLFSSEFKLDGATKEAIKQAKMKFDKKAASLDLQHIEYNTFHSQTVQTEQAQSRLSVTASYSGSNLTWSSVQTQCYS